MKRFLLSAVVILFLAGAVAVGGFWYFVLRDAPPPGDPMTAVPIVSSEQGQSPASTAQPGQPTPLAGGASIFTLDPSQTQARFTLGEILAGQPNTVIGSTNLVSGEISADPQQPTAARIGTIQVDARGFATDNSMRNRAIQTFILDTNTYQYITFVPTGVSGLPASVAVGQAFSFQVTGDLTIRDVTRQVVFDVEVTPVSTTRLEGLASATINRGDFGLTIPQVPRVASVDEAVLLELQFVATAPA